VALLTSFFPECVTALRAVNRRVLGADAVVALLAAIGIGLLLHQIQGLLRDRFHAHAVFAISSPDLIVSAGPALAAMADAVRSTILLAAVIGTIVLIMRKLPEEWMKLAAGLLGVCTLLPLNIRTPGELALQYGIAVVAGAGAVAFCLWFARGNYLAYALVLWAFSLRGPLGELFGNSIPRLQAQGWILVAVLAASLVWTVWPAVMRRPMGE